MRIDSGCVYDHSEYGEVLVLVVAQEYEWYDSETDDGIQAGVVVRYAREWDGYGAMWGATAVEPIDEFEAAAGPKRRDFDPISR